MLVVYETQTGHVLGALSTTGPAAADVTGLVGDALRVRAMADAASDGVPADRVPIDIPVRAERLAVASVEDTPGALAEPTAYAVEVVGGTPRTRLRPLARWTGELEIGQGGVTVRLGSVSAQVLVVAARADGTDVPLAGAMDGGEAVLPATLDEGEYGVLALVAGYAGHVEPRLVS